MQNKKNIHSVYIVIGEVQAITTEEVDEAIYYAHHTQKGWAEASLQERAKFLNIWADFEHDGINMISFTGGTNTRTRLSKKAGMIPLVLQRRANKDPLLGIQVTILQD